MDDSSETGLALYNGVWYTHLTAESGKEDDELNWVNIVGNEYELGLLGLDEGNDVVETVLDRVWLLRDVLLLLALSDGGGLLVQTLLLLDLGLRAVLVEELKGLGGGVAVESLRELGDRWWDLQAHVEDLALALQAHVLGPADHARQVALGLDVLANAIVAWAALDERVLQNVSDLESPRTKKGLSKKRVLDIPLPASCSHQPWWPGMELERLSCRRLLEAVVIESQHCCPL